MWKRDDAVKPTPPGGSGPSPAGVTGPQPTQTVNPAPATERSSEGIRGMEKGPVNIGKSVVIKGELTGILLWTQQALETPALPSAAEAKLKSVYEVADKIRARLGVTV